MWCTASPAAPSSASSSSQPPTPPPRCREDRPQINQNMLNPHTEACGVLPALQLRARPRRRPWQQGRRRWPGRRAWPGCLARPRTGRCRRRARRCDPALHRFFWGVLGMSFFCWWMDARQFLFHFFKKTYVPPSRSPMDAAAGCNGRGKGTRGPSFGGPKRQPTARGTRKRGEGRRGGDSKCTAS